MMFVTLFIDISKIFEITPIFFIMKHYSLNKYDLYINNYNVHIHTLHTLTVLQVLIIVFTQKDTDSEKYCKYGWEITQT